VLITASRQYRVSLPEPRLTIWTLSQASIHPFTRVSTAVARTYVPMLIRGGLGEMNRARGTKYGRKSSSRYPFTTADRRARAASLSVDRIAASGSIWLCWCLCGPKRVSLKFPASRRPLWEPSFADGAGTYAQCKEDNTSPLVGWKIRSNRLGLVNSSRGDSGNFIQRGFSTRTAPYLRSDCDLETFSNPFILCLSHCLVFYGFSQCTDTMGAHEWSSRCGAFSDPPRRRVDGVLE
jgi:hypothetical protein